jgi:hypothetical protein
MAFLRWQRANLRQMGESEWTFAPAASLVGPFSDFLACTAFSTFDFQGAFVRTSGEIALLAKCGQNIQGMPSCRD